MISDTIYNYIIYHKIRRETDEDTKFVRGLFKLDRKHQRTLQLPKTDQIYIDTYVMIDIDEEEILKAGNSFDKVNQFIIGRTYVHNTFVKEED